MIEMLSSTHQTMLCPTVGIMRESLPPFLWFSQASATNLASLFPLLLVLCSVSSSGDREKTQRLTTLTQIMTASTFPSCTYASPTVPSSRLTPFTPLPKSCLYSLRLRLAQFLQVSPSLSCASLSHIS